MLAGLMPTLPGSPPVEIVLRRSARARRFTLRVSRMDGRVTLSIPVRAREAEAMAFLRAQEDWLRRMLAEMPAGGQVVAPGARLPVEGVELELVPAAGRQIRVEGGAILVPGDPAQMPARVQAWLKARARDRLVAATDAHAATLGRRVSRVTLRDTRSRWGSCAASGAIMYSWRLIMAPPAVLDYVAAHEVAHLVEMNHSDAFWAVVSRLCPDWRTHRGWLRSEGQALQGWRFGE